MRCSRGRWRCALLWVERIERTTAARCVWVISGSACLWSQHVSGDAGVAKLEQLVAPPREHAAGGCDGGRMERAGGDADDLLPLEQKHAARLGFHQAVVRLSDRPLRCAYSAR